MFFRIKTDGQSGVAGRCSRPQKNRKKVQKTQNGFDDDHGVHGPRTANVSTALKSLAFFLQCGYNFEFD